MSCSVKRLLFPKRVRGRLPVHPYLHLLTHSFLSALYSLPADSKALLWSIIRDLVLEQKTYLSAAMRTSSCLGPAVWVRVFLNCVRSCYSKFLFCLLSRWFAHLRGGSPGLCFISRLTLLLWLIVGLKFIICYCFIWLIFCLVLPKYLRVALLDTQQEKWSGLKTQTLNFYFRSSLLFVPITVAARYEAWNTPSCSNTRIVGSNPSRGMDVCPRFFFCVSVVLCR